jgi:hypothetical protein
MTPVNFPDELRQHYHHGRLIPFVGAGASMSVDWMVGTTPTHGPSWSELVDRAAIELGMQPRLLRVRGTDLQILEYFRLTNQIALLTNWLVREMAPPDAALRDSPIHDALAALTNCRLIYTTNFDDFIERSFGLLGRRCRVVASEAEMASSGADCEIIKFHGDLNHPQGMVLSESDYERRLAFTTPLDFRFQADVLNRAVLFIGYSFRDQNVAYLFRLINERFDSLPHSNTGRRAYIVVPEPSRFEIELFRARNIEVIPVSADNITGDIASLLSELRA